MTKGDFPSDMHRIGTALGAAIDGIVFFGPDGTIQLANASFSRMIGIPVQDLAGMNIDTLIDDGHRQWYERAVKAETGTKPQRLRTAIARDHDDPLPVEITLNHDAATGMSFSILRDLSKTIEIEAQLNELQSDLLHMARIAAMNEMGAALAHELNQPLMASLLYLQAAKTSLPAGAAHDMMDKAAHEVQRAAAIIRRIRNFVEKTESFQSIVDLTVLIEEALELVRLGSTNKPEVVLDIGKGLPSVTVDHVQIEQVIVNVLRNAFEAVSAEENPRITVSLREKNERLALTIADNGPGIPLSQRDQMFHAFSTTKENSLGVGLAISRSIAQNHGGNLELDDHINERGASFTLTLPIERHGAGSPAETARKPETDVA